MASSGTMQANSQGGGFCPQNQLSSSWFCVQSTWCLQQQGLHMIFVFCKMFFFSLNVMISSFILVSYKCPNLFLWMKKIKWHVFTFSLSTHLDDDLNCFYFLVETKSTSISVFNSQNPVDIKPGVVRLAHMIVQCFRESR